MTHKPDINPLPPTGRPPPQLSDKHPPRFGRPGQSTTCYTNLKIIKNLGKNPGTSGASAAKLTYRLARLASARRGALARRRLHNE